MIPEAVQELQFENLESFEKAMREKFGNAVARVERYAPRDKGQRSEILIELVHRPTIRMRLIYDSQNNNLYLALIPPQRGQDGPVAFSVQDLDLWIADLEKIKEIAAWIQE